MEIYLLVFLQAPVPGVFLCHEIGVFIKNFLAEQKSL